MKKTYVLNKPALLTSENALLGYEGNDIVIPIAVIEDLQAEFPRLRSARKAIANSVLDYLDSCDFNELSGKGVTLENGTNLKVSVNYTEIDVTLDGVSPKERRILQTCLGLKEEGKDVVLIANKQLMRMKARQLGITAEGMTDRVFPAIKDQYKGYEDVYCSAANISQLHKNGYLNIDDIYAYEDIDWQTNLYLNIKGENSASALAYFDGEKIVPITIKDNPCGIKPKNVRQKFLIHALMDTSIPLLVVKGDAGTGKTYCSLGAGIELTRKGIYDQILITKSTKKVDQEELGFLPGDIMEKVDPFISGIYDNLEILCPDWKKTTEGLDMYGNKNMIEIQTLGHIRGRSIMNKIFIIDETQNISPEAIKQIVTRAGEGSKFVFLGDPTQIDAPELTERYNGLVYLSEMMKGQKLCRQITLNNPGDAVRSPLAQLAVETLL